MNTKRREFLNKSLIATAGAAAIPYDLMSTPAKVKEYKVKPVLPKKLESIRFGVIGLNHGHIYGQVNALLQGGGEFVGVFAKEQELLDRFTKQFPQAKIARSEEEILEDPTIQLIASASIPADRAPLGIRAMKNGKDFMADKPGIISLEQLAEVKQIQKETGRIYSIMYSERLGNRASVQAGDLIQSGAIGNVVQTIGLGPHRMRPNTRPDWFFDPKKFGGILTDIGSHQCDQFLYYTGSDSAKVITSQVGNINNSQYPGFDDFGDMQVRGNKGTGYIRIDWFTPDGLNTWGDGRTFILGTEGYIEMRKYVDIAGKKGENHLFLVDGKETKYFDCSEGYLPYGEQLVKDVVNRTETAMTQHHCFLATELALIGQKNADRLKFE